MTNRVKGRCECGSVAFEVERPLRDVVACHCGQCRRTSGHFGAFTSAPVTALHVLRDDGLAWYRSSAQAERGFCRNCGSSLFWKPLTEPERISIAAGALDGPTGLRLVEHIYAEDRGDYYTLDPLP